MGWFNDWFGGGSSSNETSNETSNDNDNDDEPSFFEDGGAFESFFDSVGLDVDGDAADGVSGGVANLGDTDGDGVGEFAFTDNASDEDRSNVESGNVGTAAQITNVSGNITDTPVDTGSSDPDPEPAGPTFEEAFAAARAEQGPGGVFTWNGQQYTTNTAEEEAAAAEPEPEEEFGEDYTPTAEELAAQLEEAGLESAITDPLSVEEQVQLYEDDGLLTEVELADGTTTSVVDLVDYINELEADLSASEAMGEMEQSGALDDTILGTGEGGLQDPDPGLAVGDPMTPQLALELGVTYFEGDTLQSADIEALRDLGFAVDESTITGTLDGATADAATGSDPSFTGAGTVDEVSAVLEANASDDPKISASRLSDLESYVADLLDIQGSYSVEDLDGAGFTADEIAAYEQLVAPGTLSAEDLAAIQEQYGDLTMAQYNALEETFGSYLGTMLKGSAGLITEMTGNLLSAAGEIDKKTLDIIADATGFDFLRLENDAIATQVGEGLVSSGQETKEQFLEQLETRYPEEYEDFMSPIFDPETGEFNGDALKTKALYSSLPTLAGFAGLPFGSGAFLVTGGLMTAGEIGTEARNEAYDIAKAYVGPNGEKYSEEEAQMIGRSANLLGATLGVPIGVVSNKLFIDTLAPGVGAPIIAKITSAAIQSALDEGYVEQVAIGTAVNSMFEGQEGPLADITQGTDAPSEAVDQFFGNIAFDRFSMDEAILGGLTGLVAGGAITMSGYSKAKAAGMSDQEILNQAKATPEGETVTLTDSSGNVVAEGTVPVSDIMFSGNPIEMRTDSDGNSVVVDTVTGETAVMPAGTTLEAGETTGTETTVNDLTASEILQGNNITIGQDSEGNITLTDNDTGLTTNVEGDLFYDAFGNSYDSAEAAAAADAGYGLTGDETTVGDLQQQEDNVIEGEGAEVKVSVTSEGVTLTNEDTGMTVVVPSGNTESIVDIVDAIQNNDTSTVETLGGTVSDIGTTAPSVEDITAGVLAALPESVTVEQVTSAINEAVSGIDTVSQTQVEQIVTDTLGSIDTLTEQEVSEIVQNMVSSQEVLAQSDVEAIVADAMSTIPTVEDITASVLASLPESATPQQVTDAINTAISDLENLSSSDVQQIVGEALGSFETLTAEDVTGIVEGVVAAQDVLSAADVQGIVDTALSAQPSVEDITASVLASLPESATPEQVTTAINDAISDLENLSSSDVQQIVAEALGSFETLSEQDVTEIVESVVAAQDVLTEQDVSGIVDAVQVELETQITNVRASLTEQIDFLQQSGMDRAAAVDFALTNVANRIGTTEQALLNELGTTESELQAGFEAGIGSLEETLNTRIGELEAAGVDRAAAVDQALSELSTNLGTTEQALLDELGTTASELQAGFEAGLGSLEETLNTRISELEAAGVDRAAAVDQALSELSTSLGTTEQELLARVGETEESLLSEIGSVEQSLIERTQELEESGIARDEALRVALGEVATNLGTTEESLLSEIGQTEESLLGEIGEVQAGLTQQIGAVEQTLIERTQELEQSGLARDEALQVALGEVAANLGTTEQALLNEIGQTQQSLTQQIENVQTELSTELGVTNTQLAEIVAIMEEEQRKEEEYLASLEGEPELDRTPDYIPSVAPQVGNIITEDGTRPVVAPYYQPQQAGVFSVYRPQPGVVQTPQRPVIEPPQTYLAPTAAPQYGYGYIAPNADIEYLRNLARVQGTGAERLASERLMGDE